MKMLISALLAVFIVLTLSASALGVDFTPQGDINLRNIYNITNDPIGNCPSGEVVQGKLSDGTWNCTTVSGSSSDTQKSGGAPYLYNDSTAIYLNETPLNNTIDSRISLNTDTDTQKNTSSSDPYLSNDSTTIYFDEAYLNGTIDSRDDDTTYTETSPYLSLVGTAFSFVESYLNDTINSIIATYGFFNNIGNFTGTLTDGRICTYDSAGTEIDCDTDYSSWDTNSADDFSGSWGDLSGVPAGFSDDVDNDTTYSENSDYLTLTNTVFGFDVDLLNSTIDARDSDTTYSDLSEFTDSGNLYQEDIGSDCAVGQFAKGVDNDGTLDCDTPAGGGGTGAPHLVDNGTYISLNASYAINLDVQGWITSSNWTDVLQLLDTEAEFESELFAVTTPTEDEATNATMTSYVDDLLTNSANWDTAYGWGDHGAAGYYSASNPYGYYNDSDFSIADYSTTSQMNTAIGNANTSMKGYVDALDTTDHGDGGNCGAGEYPLGVDADGAVQSCTDATTEINSIDQDTNTTMKTYVDNTFITSDSDTWATNFTGGMGSNWDAGAFNITQEGSLYDDNEGSWYGTSQDSNIYFNGTCLIMQGPSSYGAIC